MKTKIFVLFLFTLIGRLLFPQINTNEFVKIGFTDLNWLKLWPAYYYWQTSYVNYADSHYYYPRLEELGLNYIVTMANFEGPLNPNHNTSIKMIDNDFRTFVYGYPYLYGDPQYDLTHITYSTGNDPEFYAYEAGGDSSADIADSSHKFGFGNVVDIQYNVWKFSHWLRDTSETVGDRNKEDLYSTNTIRVFYAGVSEHNEGYI
ncbi:MAG: hypothetical protein FJW56_04575 [Actinobacteria bacterium]|nr:hypothetical protein [Actinomycetota bacterium]